MTTDEVMRGLRQCLSSLELQARAIPQQKSWSPAEKLMITLSVKFEYEAVRHALSMMKEQSHGKT